MRERIRIIAGKMFKDALEKLNHESKATHPVAAFATSYSAEAEPLVSGSEREITLIGDGSALIKEISNVGLIVQNYIQSYIEGKPTKRKQLRSTIKLISLV